MNENNVVWVIIRSDRQWAGGEGDHLIDIYDSEEAAVEKARELAFKHCEFLSNKSEKKLEVYKELNTINRMYDHSFSILVDRWNGAWDVCSFSVYKKTVKTKES